MSSRFQRTANRLQPKGCIAFLRGKRAAWPNAFNELLGDEGVTSQFCTSQCELHRQQADESFKNQ